MSRDRDREERGGRGVGFVDVLLLVFVASFSAFASVAVVAHLAGWL